MRNAFIFLLLSLCANTLLAAECWISEYDAQTTDADGRTVGLAREPAPIVQNVTTITISEASADFDEETRFVIIICDILVHYRFSTADDDDVTTSYPVLPAYTELHRAIEGVGPGQTQTLKVELCDTDCS